MRKVLAMITAAAALAAGTAAATASLSTIPDIPYEKFTLPTFRSPLAGEGEVSFRDEVDHAFFLRCCELYRVLDLLERNTDKLVEIYSKYRNRQQFADTLGQGAATGFARQNHGAT